MKYVCFIRFRKYLTSRSIISHIIIGNVGPMPNWRMLRRTPSHRCYRLVLHCVVIGDVFCDYANTNRHHTSREKQRVDKLQTGDVFPSRMLLLCIPLSSPRYLLTSDLVAGNIFPFDCYRADGSALNIISHLSPSCDNLKTCHPRLD